MKFCVFAPRSGTAVFASAVLAMSATGLHQADPATAGSIPSEISADYKVTLGGFDVGTFRYGSSVKGDVYTLSSDVDLSLFLGAFNWRGISRTVGKLNAGAPKPTGFDFNFESTLKNGAVRMGFDRGTVNSVSVVPSAAPAPDLVPVKQQHLKNVVDPLTAIMALTKSGGSPCDRKVAIFDGRQRFDLELVFRRLERLHDGNKGAVCMIRYRPIAGYRASPQTSAMAQSTGIEITFRAVPSAGLNVPQRIVLPTLAGEAEITAQRIRIKPPSRGKVALAD